MARLIYHPLDAAESSVSPFDAAIMELSKSCRVRIACPYIGRVPLQRLVDHSTDWQLITDIGELLRLQSLADRKWFVQFIVENADQVRHCRDLHAKVVVGERQALVGSANLTMAGLTRRTEMSVLLSDAATVRELASWFEDVWHRCSSLDSKSIRQVSRSLPKPRPEHPLASLPVPPGPQVQSRLSHVTEGSRGRWSEAAYISLVGEKWPHLLDSHIALLDLLKRQNAARFAGDGNKKPTYHAVLPESGKDILWIYADGTLYARWSKLPVPLQEEYMKMLSDCVELDQANGEPKTDGSNLNIRIDRLKPSRIGRILRGLVTAVDKHGRGATDEREARIVEFLKTRPTVTFTADEIRQNTGVPKRIVHALVKDTPAVSVTGTSRKRFYSFKTE